MQGTFKLILNNKSFPLPLKFYHFQNISQDILQILIKSPDNQYHVQTNVPEEIFMHFIDYLVENKIDDINSDNFYYYFQLCEEFKISDLISKKKSEFSKYLININGLQYCKKDFLTKIEEEISENLDEYLKNSGELLMKSPIQSLIRIFDNAKLQPISNNLAYELITKQFENSQDPAIFILLDNLDGSQLSEKNLKESLELQKMRLNFMPHIDFSYLSNQFEKLFLSNKILNEKVNELNNQVDELISDNITNQKQVLNEYKKIEKKIKMYKIISFVFMLILSFSFYKIEKINKKTQSYDNLFASLLKMNNITDAIKKHTNIFSEIEDIKSNIFSKIEDIKSNIFSEIEDIKSNISKLFNQVTITKQNSIQITNLNKKIRQIKQKIYFPNNQIHCETFTANISRTSQGILSILKSKEKNKFNPLFIASLSSNDIYDLLNSNIYDFYIYHYNNEKKKKIIKFEIYKNVTISGIQIFASFCGFLKSFDIQIGYQTIVSIKEAQELNGKYKNMTIKFDPIESDNIALIITDRNWDDDRFFFRIKQIELLSTDPKYANGVFSKLISESNNHDPHQSGIIISSSDNDLNTFQQINATTCISTFNEEMAYLQIELLHGFAVLNGFRLQRHILNELTNYKIIATDNKDKPIDEWLTLINVNKIGISRKLMDIYKFDKPSTAVKFIRLVQLNNGSNIEISHFDIFGTYIDYSYE